MIYLAAMDDEIAEQLARRDRFRRYRWRGLSAQQRVEEMMRLQQRSWDTLRSNPVAYQLWFRQNWSSRATRPVDRRADAT